jgi:N-hydroxyarylamine O-acetyltransferase
MTDDPWDVDSLDLAAYLDRIGVRPGPPSRAALDELTEAHVRTFSFDNIDVLLDQHAGVALAAVADKFVGRGRGGYCFEHVTLFAAALERLGYDVVRRLGRVGDPRSAARTHLVAVVSLDGENLMIDPGFGLSALRPVPLRHGARDDHRGWVFEIASREGLGVESWELSRLTSGGWEAQHTHDDTPVVPVDVAVGHHYTSTHPLSHFRHRLVVTRHEGDRHTTVTEEHVTVRRPGHVTTRHTYDLPDLPALLRQLAVPVTASETDRLLDRVAGLREEQRAGVGEVDGAATA